MINCPARRGCFVRMPQPLPSVRNRSRHWTHSCLWMRWLSHWSAHGQVLGEHSAKLILSKTRLETQTIQKLILACAYACFVITHTKIPHSKTQESLNWNIVSTRIWCLPIQAIIQAAFFSLIIRRSTVACSRFITRQRLHVHVDICDRGRDFFPIIFYSNKASSTKSESYL